MNNNEIYRVDPFQRYNCYKLLRHTFISGKVLLLKTPDNLDVVRRNLKELSDIVEKEDRLSSNSSIRIPGEKSPQKGVSFLNEGESDRIFNNKRGSPSESPRTFKELRLAKVNTGKSVYEDETERMRNGDKPKITILQCETDLSESAIEMIDEGDIVRNWNYSFKGPGGNKKV